MTGRDSTVQHATKKMHSLLLLQKRSAPVAAAAAGICFLLFYRAFQTVPAWFAAETGNNSPNYFSMALFATIPAFAVWHYGKMWIRKQIRLAMGRDILAPLAEQINPEMKYSPTENIPEKTLAHSLLFDGEGAGKTRIEGAGSAQGKIEGIQYQISSLRVDRQVQHGCRRRGGTLFGGVFICFHTGEHTKELVVATPRSQGVEENVVRGRLGEDDTAIEEIVFYDDHEFDRWFYVVGTGKQIGREVLTKNRRERLTSLLIADTVQPFLSKRGTNLYVAFEGEKMFWHLPDKIGTSLEEAKELCTRYHDEFVFVNSLLHAFASFEKH